MYEYLRLSRVLLEYLRECVAMAEFSQSIHRVLVRLTFLGSVHGDLVAGLHRDNLLVVLTPDLLVLGPVLLVLLRDLQLLLSLGLDPEEDSQGFLLRRRRKLRKD